MGQVRHGSATTTHAVRAAIQRSQASLAQLSQELGINPKTVAKWRKRETIEDRKTGPTEPSSTVLNTEEEAMAVAGRMFCNGSAKTCPNPARTRLAVQTATGASRPHGVGEVNWSNRLLQSALLA